MSKGQKCLTEVQSRNPQGTVSLLELDISSDASISAAAKTLSADFGRLDVLINNAGISARPDPGLPRAKILEIYNTNAVGPMLLTEALTPLLKASSNPRVINVSSVLGSVTERFDPKSGAYNSPWDAYRMSKAALNMATACQHKALGQFGCKVWAFCPGFVITNLSGEADRQWRKDNGGESSETSAQGILEIVEGKRDSEVGTFIARYGKSYRW
jgi:NAD(P)-dependent dehydrogenase (short-subunit alcohol dehydrogenase family)